MSRDSTVLQLRQPDAIDDPLTEIAREGARRMLAQVLIAGADAFGALWTGVKRANGRPRARRPARGPAERDGGVSRGPEPLGGRGVWAFRREDLGVREAGPLILVDQMGGRPATVVGPVRLARDAGNSKEGFELPQTLLAGLLQQLLSVCHVTIFSS